MAEPNAFAGFDPTGPDEKAAAASLTPKVNGADNAFAGFNPIDDQEGPKTSGIGAFVRGAVGGAGPAAAALRGGYYGAEIGAATPVPGGALVGAVIGGLAGSFLTDEAQSWLLDKVPRFRDLLGQSEEQKAQDQKDQQALSFMGGLFPYAITMNPAAALEKLPANATNFQKLLNNQATARLMSAGIVGGMQLGQEAVEQEHVSWPRVAIATGFGLIFNKPNRLGEKISGIPAKPATLEQFGPFEPHGPPRPEVFGPPEQFGPHIPEPFAPWPPVPFGPEIPTIAQIGDTMAGPGWDDDSWMGSTSRSAASENAAITAAATERRTIGPGDKPDVESQARKTEPELFERYDAAQNRLAAARQRIREFNQPTATEIGALKDQASALREAEQADIEKHNGWRGSSARRRLGAQAREVEGKIDLLNERSAAFREGRAEETPYTAAARKEITDARNELFKIQPEIQAAYRAAADYTGAPIVAPPTAQPPAAEPLAAAPQPATQAGHPAPAVSAPAEPAVAAAPPIAPAAPAPRPNEQQAAIAKTAYDRMVRVGEPPERAEWLSRLTALATSVRAARFGGALGDAAGLYAREGEKYAVFRENGPAFEVTPPPAQPEAPVPTNRQELAAFLAAGGKIEAAARAPGAPLKPLVVPPYFVLRDDGVLIDEHTREPIAEAPNFKNGTEAENWLKEKGVDFGGVTAKSFPGQKEEPLIQGPKARARLRAEGFAKIVAEHEKVGMIDNAEDFKAAAKKRAERGGGTVQLTTTAEKMAREGKTTKEVNQEFAAASRSFDQYLMENKLAGDKELERLRPLIVERIYEGFEPEDAIDLATNKDEVERDLIDDPEARQAAEDFAAMEEGHGFFSEVSPAVGGGPAEAGQRGQGEGTEGTRAAGEAARETGAEQDVEDYFQAAKGGKKLGAIRLEANGLATILRDMGSADASTIIHELGHHWLATLIRDSLHSLAPQQLRDDAAAALRFLGLKSADELNARTKAGDLTAKARKAQERWATGVEQYFYEGRAPAPELVPLFDRFKNWLRDVYKTIKDIVTVSGEHYPINDEFRGIMDRMLTMPEGETVIMPEGERGGPTIQDIHEADARATEPQEGEQVRDHVVAERDRYAEELPSPVKTGLEAAAVEHARKVLEAGGAEPAAEGGAGPGGLREVERGRGAAEPTAPGGGGGKEPGKIVEGGAPARPESPVVPGAREPGRAELEHPLAPGPTDNAIPEGGTDVTDYEGNVRPENITNVEKERQAIIESSERNNDFKDVRGDTVTDQQLWDLATEAGQDPNTLNYDQLRAHLANLLGGMKDMAKKVLAARRMLKQSATEVARLAKLVRDNWSDDDAMDFAIAVTKHDMIQSDLSGATASWGRTGRAFRDITEGWDVKAANKNAQMMAQTGKTLFQIKQMASLMAEYDSVNQVSQFIRDRGKPRAGRMVMEYWINGLISGLQTHMTYAVGNTILALEKIGPETAAAAAVGAIRKGMGREGETVRIGEVAAGIRGIRAGFWPAVQSALHAAQYGTTTLLPSEAPSATMRFQAPLSQIGSQAVLDESAKFSDVMATTFGIVRGIREAVKAGAALQRAGGRPDAPIFGWEWTPRGAIPNFQYRGVTVLPVGDIARLPSRMVSAIHSFFRPLNYAIEIHQRAYREAANQNLQGAHFDSSVAGNISKPPIEWMEAAYNMSNDLTLMGQGGEWTKKLSGLANHEFLGEKDPISGKRIPGTGWPFLKFIDPFVHISSNIINEALVKRTPIGLAPALFGKETPLIADLKGRNGNVRADMAAARMLTGTAMTILFGSLAAEGYVTGSEPSNPQDAALWRQVYQAHSVRIGDTWYAMNRLGPMGMLLSTAADLYNVAHNAEEGEYAEAAAALHHAVSQNILDESFMRGPSDLIKAIEEPGRYGASYVRNFVSSFVPFSVAMSQMARNLDPYTRQARTLTDALVAKVPLLSQELLPRRDIWGEPLPSRYGLGADATAIWEKQVNSDPVNRVLMDRAIKVAMVERKIRNVQLTPEQYDDYARISGRLTKMNLDRLILSPSFNQMPRGTQHDIIVENMRQSRETARNMMFMKYQSLLVDAHDAKMRRREGPQ